MQYVDPPRSAFGAPPQGGAASGPAKPVPRRPLGGAGFAALVMSAALAGCSTLGSGVQAIQDTVVTPVAKALAPAPAASADAVARAVVGGAAPASRLVDAGMVTDGQMLRGSFLAALREAVCKAGGNAFSQMRWIREAGASVADPPIHLEANAWLVP